MTSEGPAAPDVMEIGSGSDAPWTLRNRRRIAIVGAAALALALTAVVFYGWGSTGKPAAAPAASARPSPSASRTPTTAEVYTAVSPSVVSIEAASSGTAGASGTGIIVNGNGAILTANHVIQGATSIRVTFGDGSTTTAAVMSSDPAHDIALLAPGSLPSVVVPAVLGSANRLAVGDGVIAIGNPLRMTLSTTTGVVSGLNRGIAGPDGTKLSGLIQFDAAVNPGSSGGPLLNARGETVGIVVALANPTSAGTFIGIGFAVPIGTALATGGGQAPQQ